VQLLASFRPALIKYTKHYTRADFRADFFAGITIGVIALPLAMAFAIASGVKPEQGLITAIIAGFIISALGGTRHCIGGPTGAFVVVLYGVLLQYGWQNLVICTIMAGVMLVAMGALRMGALIRFVPQSVIMGFTNGIAVLIALSQLRDALGLQIAAMPGEFFGVIRALFAHAASAHWPTCVLAALCLFGLFAWPPAWAKRLPAPVVMLAMASFAVWALERAGVSTGIATIGSRFGGVPQTLPALQWPQIELEKLGKLLPPAITIALLAAIESLLCAVVADQQTHATRDQKHDANQELIAQGIANIVSPLFGGIAATGAIARTSANIRNGAVSPVSGIIHALVLLSILLIAAPLATHIPLAVLAAILLWVAFNMGDWRAFAEMKRYTLFRNLTFIATFLLTVIFDLTIAVEVGMVLATLLLIKRLTAAARVEEVSALHQDDDAPALPIPADCRAFRLHGALFFGVAEQVEAALAAPLAGVRAVALEMREVIYLDSTVLTTLTEFIDRAQVSGVRVVVVALDAQAYDLMRRTGLLAKLATEDVVRTRRQAQARLLG
jgi:sulfate permease, SulP family